MWKQVEVQVAARRHQERYLEPGCEQEVIFTRRPGDGLIDYEGKAILEPGTFDVYIGGSQPDARSIKLTGTPVQKVSFEVAGERMELEY